MPLTPIAIKIYTAIVTQDGTNPPISTPLNNTMGITTTTWTRNSEGDYQLDTNIPYNPTKLYIHGQTKGNDYESNIYLINNANNSQANFKIELNNNGGNLSISLKTLSGWTPLPAELSSIANQVYLPEIRLYNKNIQPFN